MHVYIIDDESRHFNKYDIVKYTKTGNIVEIMEIEHKSQGCAIKRLGGDLYCKSTDFDEVTGEVTGEVFQMVKCENRAENIAGMRKSMKHLRDLINCNVVDPNKCRWVTLTYRENMQDNFQLTRDHEAFIKRLRRYHKRKGFPAFQYILAVEPQARGAWHIHTLWIYDDKAPFLLNEDIAEIWGHGFVSVRKLDNVDNVGAYLTAYMCDVDIEKAQDFGVCPDDFDIKFVPCDGQAPKKYLKGARLHFYPSGMNFYRCSQGIKRPDVSWISRDKAYKKVRGAALTYSKTIRLSDGDFENDIHYEYYNTVKACPKDQGANPPIR